MSSLPASVRDRMYLNLKIELWRSGIRQYRFAQLVGIHETVLSKIVNGFREPDAETKTRIAQLLNRDEQWLFTAEEAPSRIQAANDQTQQSG